MKINDGERSKVVELAKIKEELMNSKDIATQSWLASRPLTDDLEKLKSNLSIATNRTFESTAVISDLQLKIDATNLSFKSKTKEQLSTKKIIGELSETVDIAHKELETIKKEIYEERKMRSKLKQVLRMRRQKLRTLNVTLQATEMESDAFAESAAEALEHIKNSETDNKNVVQITQEEYYCLVEKAKEETALAEWRISLFTKQKFAAEVSRNSCLSGLKQLKRNESKGRETNEDENIIDKVKEEEESPTRGSALLEVREKTTDKLDQNLQKPRRRSRCSNRKNTKKKPSILIRVKSFLVRSIARLFR